MPPETESTEQGQQQASGSWPDVPGRSSAPPEKPPESASARRMAALADAETAMRAMTEGAGRDEPSDDPEPEQPPQRSSSRTATTTPPTETAKPAGDDLHEIATKAALKVFGAMHEAAASKAAAKVQQAEQPPAKPKRRGPMSEDDLAREMARQIAPPGLEDEELGDYAQEARDRLAISTWLKSNPDHEQAPAMRDKLAFLQVRAQNASLQREIAELRSNFETLSTKVGEVETAPKREQQRQSQVEHLAMVLGNAENAGKTGYPALHRIGAKSPEKAAALAQRIYDRAFKDGKAKDQDEYLSKLDQAARELEELYAIDSDAPAASGDRPAPTKRPDVTPAAASGSPARRDPYTVSVEEHRKMTPSQKRAAAHRAAEEEFRRGDTGRRH